LRRRLFNVWFFLILFLPWHGSYLREEEQDKSSYFFGPISKPASHGAVICGGMPPKG
jgi:hypothetical protein